MTATLVNFDDDVTTASTIKVEQPTSPVIAEKTVTRPMPSSSSKHLLRPVENWGWEEVRDFVVSSIEKTHGAFPRNFKTEGSIFKSFCNRWGNQAGPIAQMAFNEFDGMWKGSPISVNRFCVASDVYFALPLSERLT